MPVVRRREYSNHQVLAGCQTGHRGTATSFSASMGKSVNLERQENNLKKQVQEGEEAGLCLVVANRSARRATLWRPSGLGICRRRLRSDYRHSVAPEAIGTMWQLKAFQE